MGLLFGNFSSWIIGVLITVPIVLICLTVHELAHALVSVKLGDPTPRYEGRLSLNPLRHLDPLGTLLMIFSGFGWAKPVSVNPMYYKDRKKGMALVAAAGPVSNLVMAVTAFAIYAILYYTANFENDIIILINVILSNFIMLNLRLMVFNLIPVPPLDGSKILGMFLPNRIYYNVLNYERYAITLLMVLSLTGVFDRIIGTGVYFILEWLTKVFIPV